jgi:tetratricopeptide (TPR) repeat protein
LGFQEDLFGDFPEQKGKGSEPKEDVLEGGFQEGGAPPRSLEEDLFGEVSKPQPPSGLEEERSSTSLDQLFAEEPSPPPPGELEESVFAFSEAEETPKEEFDEDRLVRAETRVKEELFRPTPEPSPLEELPPSEPTVPPSQPLIPEEELITTLEELKKARRARASRTIWLALGGGILFIGVLFSTLFFLPSLWQKLPFVGEKVENLHAQLHTSFFQKSLLPERLSQVKKGVESLNPKEVTAVTPVLLWVLKYEPTQREARRLLLLSLFFTSLIARIQDPGAGALGSVPEMEWILWAKGEGGTAPPSETTPLFDLLRLYRGNLVEELGEGVPLTMPAEISGTEAVLWHMTLARIAEESGEYEKAFSAWGNAHDLSPNNPWILLMELSLFARHFPRWLEISELLKDLEKQSNRLSPYDQGRFYAIRVRMLLAQGKDKEALAEAGKGLAIAPDHPELLTLSGIAHFKLRHLSDATLALGKAYSLAPDETETVVAYARVINASGRMQEAVNLLKEAIRKFPEVDYYSTLIEILLNQNRLKEAEEFLEQGSLQYPEDPDLLRLGADLRLAQGDLSRATEYLDRYRTLYPDDLRAQTKLAALRIKQKDYPTAKKILAEVFARNPSDPEALRYQAEIFIVEGAYSEAERTLLHALQLDPHNLDTFLLLAEVYLGLKDPKNAQGMLQQALSLQSLNWKAQELLGRSYLLDQKVTDAVAALDKAVELSGGLPEPILWLARALELQNQPGKALDQYQRLLKADPDNEEAYRKIAELNMAIGEWRSAIAVLSEWEKKNPKSPVLYALYGKALNGKGDFSQTISILSRILAQFSRDPDILSELGWAYVKTGVPSRAQQMLLRATQLRPADGIAWYRLGIAYRDLGEKTQAKLALEKAISLGLPPEIRESAQSELKTLSY